ncbi:MAG: hypothetical protein KC656_18650, partial [Myxococcales bacterium]|nr:hypothetical protein [Myxococcales bacterium]
MWNTILQALGLRRPEPEASEAPRPPPEPEVTPRPEPPVAPERPEPPRRVPVAVWPIEAVLD